MTEKLKLVRDFAELQVGMIVVFKPCKVCHGPHRGILTETNCDAWTDVNGSICMGGVPLWRFLPKPVCSGKSHAVFTEPSVKAGKVWRVVDGLEDAKQVDGAKPKSVRA